ncbi:MAG TPA: hypothetical protein VGE46_01490 [Bdellovibrio sp.]
MKIRVKNQLIPLDHEGAEYKKISAQTSKGQFTQIFKIQNAKILNLYLKNKKTLVRKKGQKPSERILFHITSQENAKKIIDTGFKVNLAKTSAFGKGIYFAETASNAFRYANRHKKKALLVCKVVVGRAHENKSDLSKVINGYSKPDRLIPRKGFSSMFGGKKETRVWVVPAGGRILPLYLVLYSG